MMQSTNHSVFDECFNQQFSQLELDILQYSRTIETLLCPELYAIVLQCLEDRYFLLTLKIYFVIIILQIPVQTILK